MGTKQAKNVATNDRPIAMPQMAMENVGMNMAKMEPERPPHYEESRELFKEARRALKRALAHAAQYDLSYDLQRAAKALQGLDY